MQDKEMNELHWYMLLLSRFSDWENCDMYNYISNSSDWENCLTDSAWHCITPLFQHAKMQALGKGENQEVLFYLYCGLRSEDIFPDLLLWSVYKYLTKFYFDNQCKCSYKCFHNKKAQADPLVVHYF